MILAYRKMDARLFDIKHVLLACLWAPLKAQKSQIWDGGNAGVKRQKSLIKKYLGKIYSPSRFVLFFQKAENVTTQCVMTTQSVICQQFRIFRQPKKWQHKAWWQQNAWQQKTWWTVFIDNLGYILYKYRLGVTKIPKFFE